MMWAVVWNIERRHGKPPRWHAWTDRLFSSRTAAWNAVLADRGFRRIEGRPGWWTRGNVMLPMDDHRDNIIRRERLKNGLRVVPAHIEFLTPEFYEQMKDGRVSL